jgi:hypothetical protein
MQKLLWFILPVLLAPATTIRRPLYSDPTTGYPREMNQLVDAEAHPAYYVENPNLAVDTNVSVGRDQNGNMLFIDKVLTPIIGAAPLVRLVDIFQVVSASQSATVTSTTAYTTTVSASITTNGRTRVFVLAFATSSNSTAANETNLFQIVQATTQIGSRAGSGWDGGLVSTGGTAQTITCVALTGVLAAGTYTFSLQMEASGGTAQIRPGTPPEGSWIYLFEINF